MAELAKPTAGKGRRDLTTGPITRTLILFALPTLGSNILQSLNGSVNSIWVGHILGEEALAATSNANLIMFLMFTLLFGFGMAATILIGQYTGRRDVNAVREVVGTASGLFLALSLVIAVLGFVETPTLLHLLATPPEVLPLAQSYLSVIFISMPAAFLMALLTMSLRGTGDAMTPLIWMIASVAIDITLNPLLMLGIGPFPQMGIAGSATATAIASYATLIGFLIHVYVRDLPIRLRGAEWRYLVPDLNIVKTLIAKGFPMATQMVILSVSGLIMMGLINREGAVTTAAYAATQQLWNYISMPAMAVGAAVSAMTAQNIGADRWDRVSRITRSGVIFSLVVTTSMVALLAIFDRPLLGLFLHPQSPSMPVAEHIQLLATWSFIMFGITFILFGTVRANGAVWPAVIILIASLIPFRLGVAWLLRPAWGADAIWLSFPMSSAVTLLLAIAYHRWGGWRSMRMITPTMPAPAHAPVPNAVNAAASS
jgi:putative MATE family efflux protein